MNLSSKSLFHFTPKFEYLTDILRNGFWPRYCREYGWGNKYIDFAVPMVCFCDIPLSMIKEHIKSYGDFGIGVSRDWIRKQKTITPVQYVALESNEYNSINRLLTQLKNNNITDDGISKLLLVKKVSGKILDKDKTIKTKIFYNEKEWRYVPDTLQKDELILSIKKTEVFNSDVASEKTLNSKLTIDIDSIKYLIVPNEQYRMKMIKEISHTYSKENKNKKLNLISKILIKSQILNDF